MDFVRPPAFQTETSSAFRIAVLVIVHIIFAIWLKYIVARLPLGTLRVVAVLPFLAVDVVCPCFFDKDTEPLQVFCLIFILTWHCTFKVLAFCWGRAPLRESMTVAQIAATLSLPLFPKPLSRTKSGPEGRLQDSAGSGAALAVRLLGKLALTVLVVLLYEQYRETMPLVLKHYVLAFVIYAMSGIIMDGPAAVVVEALGLEVLPTFDQPWMSASLSEFWGRRWNIPTTSILRTVVYDTFAEGCLISPASRAASGTGGPSRASVALTAAANGTRSQQAAGFTSTESDSQNASAQQQQQQKGIVQQQQKQPRPSLLRRQLGLNAAFFVSGVFHEHMAWLLTGSNKLGWKWTFFFWVQAPLMSLEALGSRLLRRAGVQLPRPLTILLTHVVLQALALDLFFGHMEEQGVSQKIVLAIARCIHAARRPLQSAAVDWLEAAGLLTSS
ncbi:hypothetical protein PLESTF_000534500 [Pleodorina starrii]|nr:hypothetical protein PLESTF_000534500 [Pleodorina starrii]